MLPATFALKDIEQQQSTAAHDAASTLKSNLIKQRIPETTPIILEKFKGNNICHLLFLPMILQCFYFFIAYLDHLKESHSTVVRVLKILRKTSLT